MMKSIVSVAAVIVFAGALASTAEPMRTLITKENKFPDYHASEVGTKVDFVEFVDNFEQSILNDANQVLVTAYYRYQLAEDLAVRVDVPYGQFDPDVGDSENGFGDVALTAELRAFEDTFTFPYLIPYATYRFDTGERKAGLGDDESSFVVGATIGSTVYDVPWHVAFDVNYEIFEDSSNIAAAGASVVWDVTEQFSVLAEAQITDEELPDPIEEHPITLGGGAVYKLSDTLAVAVHGAGKKNSREDVITSIRLMKDL